MYASILAYVVNYIFGYPFHVSNDKLREAISSHVARLLKEERQRQKVSLNGLAQKAGLARQTIAFIEREVQSPSFDTLLRITFALNLELEEIIALARKRAKKASTR
jgi:DNA-binding XRE family transcriptional regulator